MSYEGGGEVLRRACALTLGDEPLAGGVEDAASELRMTAAQVGVALHHLIDSEIRKQPTSLRQSGIQQVLKDTMQRDLSLCSLGLQQTNLVGLDADKPSQVPLGCDVLSHEPTNLPRAHACEKPEEQCTVQYPVLSCQ